MIVIRFGSITISEPKDHAEPKVEPGSLHTMAPKQVAIMNPDKSTDFRHQFDSLVAHAQTGYNPLTDHKWWYIVFKPFDDQYEYYHDWYTSAKFPNWARDKFKKQAKYMVWTVEKIAAKHHVNMLVYTSADLTPFHNSCFSGYCKLYCSIAHDQRDVSFYIFKEARDRLFVQYTDYYISWESAHRTIVPHNKTAFVHHCVERARKALFG